MGEKIEATKLVIALAGDDGLIELEAWVLESQMPITPIGFADWLARLIAAGLCGPAKDRRVMDIGLSFHGVPAVVATLLSRYFPRDPEHAAYLLRRFTQTFTPNPGAAEGGGSNGEE